MALVLPLLLSAGGVPVWEVMSTFLKTEAEVKAAIASVAVWCVVYTSCEIVFVHLHHFPRALTWTVLLYFVEGIVSIPLQFGLQMYVAAVEQLSLSDVMQVSDV